MIDGLIIDSFAGGGGASTGIEMALGRSPDYAINHDGEALAMHEANHPLTIHLKENVWKVDPDAVIKGRKVALLWASPDCRHHSKAKGGAPVSKSVRGLADVVLYWARVAAPEVIALENVEEWQDWGPLDAEGRPCKARKGQDFFRWVRTLESLGYEVDWFELRACDYGAPTIRKRLFLIARRDGFPILKPKPTHGNPKSEDVKSGKLKPWRTAAEIIDWHLPCPSIFLTREAAKAQGLKVVRPLADKTMSRVARGFKRYVLDREQPFMVAVAHGDSGGRREYGLDEPHGTVTSAGQDRALITPYLAGVGGRMGQSGERPVEKPYHTITTKPDTVVVAPALAPFISYAQQGGANRSAEDPLHTVCASQKDQNQIVTGYLVPRYGEAKGQEPRSRDVLEPAPTIVPTGNGGDLAAVYLAQHNGGVIGRAADDPLSTVTTSAANQQPVAAFLAPMQSQSPGAAVDAPLGTVLAGGNHHAVVLPHLTAYYGTGDGANTDDPVRTVTTHDRFAHVEAEACTPPLAAWQIERARQVAEFLRAEGVWTGGEFVTVGPYIVWDIGMRMLTPRELARAQGFRDSYILSAPLPGGGTLTETAQRHKIGNSVSPPPAAALIRANLIEARTMPKKRRKLVKLPDPETVKEPVNWGLFDGEAAA